MPSKQKMAVPMVLLKVAAHCLCSSCYRAARKLRNHGFLHKTHQPRPPPSSPSSPHHLNLPSATKLSPSQHHRSLVADFGSLLRPTPSHFFPFFMLVAFEGGSLLRALLLLLCSPLLWALGFGSVPALRIMVFVAFCGLKARSMDIVGRAVLPKFYLESLHLQAYEALASVGGRRALLCSLPRVMFEGFAREHLGAGEVVGLELQVVGGYFTGLISYGPGPGFKQKGLKDLFDVGLVSPSSPHDHLLISCCKQAYTVSNSNSASSTMPRSKYPKPLIFHDSRLAFLPTPLSTLALFMFLPLAVPLAVARIALGVLPPYRLMYLPGAALGVRFRIQKPYDPPAKRPGSERGVVYACTHRTLLDPVMLAIALQRPVPAVTYSLSPLSEAIAPMRTVRLTRNREADSDTMLGLLRGGDLTICPEGTTCREPYLLRFSPLFAELADEVVPVAMDAGVSWLYGTTASGLKGLDPLFFFMNPRPGYRVEFLGPVRPREIAGCGSEAANRIQRMLGDALGFECTGLTRRDKYMMLAGNEGHVAGKREECGK